MSDLFWFIGYCAAAFIFSTTAFDVVHFLLHRWQRSPIPLLRFFHSLHQVHHDFLDKQMKVHPELIRENIVSHLIPEYLTSVAGTLVLALVFPLWPVLTIVGLHTVLFALRIREEGMDFCHMAMDRVGGNRGLLWASSPSYHAMHHINPLAFYSSMPNVFDLLFGTGAIVRGKRVTITGASGAFGQAMAEQLRKRGAIVTEVGRPNHVDFAETDILLLSHGSIDPGEAQAANFDSTVALAEEMIRAGSARLVPPEVWCVGSEYEILPGGGAYALSKRALARYASSNWRRSVDVTYRHIVPSAFRSRQGWGLISAKTAAAIAMFFIMRGFTYVPVTYTGLALVNWVLYRWRGRQARPAVGLFLE